MIQLLLLLYACLNTKRVIAQEINPPTLSPFTKIGKTITAPFPNEKKILGVGGLTFDETSKKWFACSENIVGSKVDDKYPDASLPRIWSLDLDFTTGSVNPTNDSGEDDVITVNPSEKLKLEDIAIVPNTNHVWLASEAHSHLVQTNVFLSKDFGAPDLSSFDPETYSTSRLIRVDVNTGMILEEVPLPEFAQWDQEYNWDASQCIGDRPFQGAHALSILPASTDSNFDYYLYVGFQSALYQDGSTPMEFSTSATRVLVYGIKYDSNSTNTATYIKSLRYDTSQLTIQSFQKGARHFNALFGMVALSESSFLVVETEDFYGFGHNNQKVINRIFYVEMDPTQSIDKCQSLQGDECAVDAPSKFLVWEREDTLQLDGIGLGPRINNENDDIFTVALTFEDDVNVGLHIEQYMFNINDLKDDRYKWTFTDQGDEILRRRIIAFIVGIVAFIVVAMLQILIVRYVERKESAEIAMVGNKDNEVDSNNNTQSKSKLNLSSYVVSNPKLSYFALATALMNSFLVGGLTFGYSGMALILRKEGLFAEGCACGSFCSKQKEVFAIISTAGFAAAIGSRLFIGFFMDKQGPKTTAILCSLTCFTALILLIIPSSLEELERYFLPAWILLSIGGSGLHLTGFHFTNLFRSDGKKIASVAISAAFGASSAIFPLMQALSQYADVKLRSMAIFYAVVVFTLGVINFLVQPWNKITPGSAYELKTGVCSKDWWHRDLKSKPFLTSVFAEVIKFDFYGEMLVYTFCLLLFTHYLSTSGQLMYELGDLKLTSLPNAWTDYIISRMAGWFNALSFVWFPLIQIILVKCDWSRCYEILISVNLVIFILIVLIKNLETQILVFSVLSFARLFLFSCHHTYLLDKFGIEFFGTLNGISSLFAAMIGFLSYPLQLFALRTNYSFSFVPIGIFVLLTFAFPIIMRRRRLLNWAETVSVDPVKFRYPKNLEEVRELILKHKKIRCAGAMHSCAPLIASEGIIMSLIKMDKILDIDPENMTVRCQSGVRIHDLCEALVPYNLAVGTLGTIDWQTISGAVMTGTHGGALTVPSLHTFITSYSIVKADGSLIKVSKTSDPELFSALAPSMGVFGVVVEVEMQCVPLQYLEARFKVISFDELATEGVFETFMRENKYARVVVYPSINKATIWYANPISQDDMVNAIKEGAVDSSNGYMNFRDENEKAWLEKFVILDKKKKYQEADSLLHKVLASQESRLGRYVGRYNYVLCKERNNGIPHADIEFNFDFSKNLQVLQTVRKYCSEHRVPYYNFEIRTTKQDDAMLSCCNGRDAMWIDFQAKAADSSAFFKDIETVLKPIGFRKHWAKGLGNTDPSYVVTQFPKMKDFVKLMGELDREGKFRNVEGEQWYQDMKDLFYQKKDQFEVKEESNLLSTLHSTVTTEILKQSRHGSILSVSSNDLNKAYELADDDEEMNSTPVVALDSK